MACGVRRTHEERHVDQALKRTVTFLESPGTAGLFASGHVRVIVWTVTEPPGPVVDPDPVLWPLLLITPAVAFMVTLPLLFAWAFVAAAAAGVLAGAAGAPALSAARKLGLRGFVPTLVLGGLVGALSTAIVVAIADAIRHRAVLSALNAEYVGVAAVIGAATGGIYATIHDAFNLPPGGARRRVLLILFIAVVLPFVLITLLGTLSRR